MTHGAHGEPRAHGPGNARGARKADPELDRVDRLLKALADPTRLRIVGLLAAGEICVCHVHDSLKISQPKASRHLAYLRRAGVVLAEKRGLWVHYRLAPQPSGVVQALLDAARHCVTHLETTRRDGGRLEKARPDLSSRTATTVIASPSAETGGPSCCRN
jgi:ArsR family transcriptional regulator, arsenate/arsenite/antimonite-responsive transcriptional repressor